MGSNLGIVGLVGLDGFLLDFGGVDFPFEIFPRAFELAHALANPPGKFGKLLGSEQQEDNQENDDHFLTTEIKKGKGVWHGG